MAFAQYISGSMLGDFGADPEDADDGDDDDHEPQTKRKKRGGTGEHPQVVVNRDITEKFEEKLRDVLSWDDSEAFERATNYKSRPTYFMTKLQACEKLSRDLLNEKEVADKFAANVVVFEKYMKLVVYLKKNDMVKFKRTQEKCKGLVFLCCMHDRLCLLCFSYMTECFCAQAMRFLSFSSWGCGECAQSSSV